MVRCARSYEPPGVRHSSDVLKRAKVPLFDTVQSLSADAPRCSLDVERHASRVRGYSTTASHVQDTYAVRRGLPANLGPICRSFSLQGVWRTQPPKQAFLEAIWRLSASHSPSKTLRRSSMRWSTLPVVLSKSGSSLTLVWWLGDCARIGARFPARPLTQQRQFTSCVATAG